MSDNADRDLRVQRQNQARLEDLAGPRPGGPSHGAPYWVGKTASDGDYPTAANRVFRVDLGVLTFQEREGSEVQLVPKTLRHYAANLGTSIPPEGTPVGLTQVPGGRFVFAYFGPEEPVDDEDE